MTMKELREASGLTQSIFSEKYEIPVQTLRNWEQGTRECPNYMFNLLKEKVISDIFVNQNQENGIFNYKGSIFFEVMEDWQSHHIFSDRKHVEKLFHIYEEIPESKAPKGLREYPLGGCGVSWGKYFHSATSGETYNKYFKRINKHIEYAIKPFKREKWISLMEKYTTAKRLCAYEDNIEVILGPFVNMYDFYDVVMYQNIRFDGENVGNEYDKYIEEYYKHRVFYISLFIKISEEDAYKIRGRKTPGHDRDNMSKEEWHEYAERCKSISLETIKNLNWIDWWVFR